MKDFKSSKLPCINNSKVGYSPYYSFSTKSSSPQTSSSSSEMKILMGTKSYLRNNDSNFNSNLEFSNVKPKKIYKSLEMNKNSTNLFSKRPSVDSFSQNSVIVQNKINRSPEISYIFKTKSDYDKANRRPRSLPLSTERKTQDKFFLYLFLVAILGSAFTVLDFIYIRKVNINLVLNGHDDWGNICGQENKLIPGAMWSGQNMINRKYMLLRLGRNYSVNSICIENCTFNDYFKTAFNRCLPKPLLLNPMFSMINMTKGFLEEILVDSVLCWREIVILCTIAVSFSFALLILIGFFVGVIIWFILFSLSALLIIITFYFWSSWYVAKEKNYLLNLQTTRQSRMLILAEKSQENWLLLSILSTLFTVLVVLFIIYLRRSLRLVSLLFKEAGKATANMPTLLILPFLTLFTLAGTCFYFTIGIISIKANQYPIIKQNSTIVDFKSASINQYFLWFNVIVFFWVCHFIFACQHYVTSASVAKWYFKRNKKISCPIISSIIELIRFHLGSLAFGSLIITGIKFFRILLTKFENLFHKLINNPSKLNKFIYFLILLIEKMIIFTNKNAYIVIALHGTNFCKSSKTALKLIFSKSFKVAIVNLVADFILFIGKAVVVLVTILLGVEFIKEKEEKLNYPWGPLLFPVIFSYFIAHCFLTVYEMTIDTLFVCFCEDSKLDEIESESSNSSKNNFIINDSKNTI